MCGIAGIIAPSTTTEELKGIARRMGHPILHRGPDGYGEWFDATTSLALVHRRLAIQDLSPAGHQPMASASGRYQIVFNGEIYNFKDLAADLYKAGFSFRGGSDTEVMLAAFEHWGVESALKKFTGMFAFALYDTKSKTLTLCRDRLGEKPLYFGWADQCFFFASELKSISAVCGNRLRTDRAAVAAYLRFGYVPGPHSIYKNIYKLIPGSTLVIELNSVLEKQSFSPYADGAVLSPRRYWSMESVARTGLDNPVMDSTQAIQEMDDLLKVAVRNQCIADVPVGAFLSGGIDSTLVASVMQAVNSRPINTFTIGFKEKEFDEAPYAKLIAKHLGTTHHEFYVSANECLQLIPQLPSIWDEPFADASQVPALLVSKMAKSQVTVCLSGDGGDEFFCGYNRYISTEKFWSGMRRAPRPVRSLVGRGLTSISPDNWETLYKFMMRMRGNSRTQANIGTKLHKLAQMMSLNSISDVYLYLLSYWNAPRDLLLESEGEASSVMDVVPAPNLQHFINDAMLWDQLGYLPDDNLVKGDRSSMAVSMELRLPLLDRHVVEYSWRLPLAMKNSSGQSKWILRQILDRYVPRQLIERPKMGFSVPIKDWLRGPLRDWAEPLLSVEALESSGFAAPLIRSSWSEHCEKKRDHSNRLWTVLMYQAWRIQADSQVSGV